MRRATPESRMRVTIRHDQRTVSAPHREVSISALASADIASGRTCPLRRRAAPRRRKMGSARERGDRAPNRPSPYPPSRSSSRRLPKSLVLDLKANADRADTREHEIIEIGACVVRRGAIVDRFETPRTAVASDHSRRERADRDRAGRGATARAPRRSSGGRPAPRRNGGATSRSGRSRRTDRHPECGRDR